MNKQKYLEGVYNSSFNDELEKISMKSPLYLSRKILSGNSKMPKERMAKLIKSLHNGRVSAESSKSSISGLINGSKRETARLNVLDALKVKSNV